MAAAKNAKKKKTEAKVSSSQKGRKPSSATATEIEQMRSRPQKSGKSQLRAIILFAIAVLLMFVALIKSEEKNVWNGLHNLLFGLFGVAGYVVPIFLGAIAVKCASDKQYERFGVRLTESGFLIWFIAAAMDIFPSVTEGLNFWDHISLAYSYKKVYGGVFGALLGHPLDKAMGTTGAKITVVILIVVMLMLVTGTTLIAAYRMLSKPVKSVGQAIENRMEERESRRNGEPQPELDIPMPGEKRGKSVEEVVDQPLNVADKRRRVIAAYRGEDAIAQPDKESAPEEAAEETETKEESPIPVISADQVTIEEELENVKAEEQKPEETPKPEKIVPILPKGASLSEIPEDEEAYRFPPLNLLQQGSGMGSAGASDHEAVGEQLVNILRSFGVETKIINISVGPSITRYELQPAAGVKISKITSLSDDIAMNLATAGVRIEAPIPNKPAVGIEVPNKKSNIVTIREIIDSKPFTTSKSKLTVAMGKDIAGAPIVTDIGKMPHGLIAGATGSGKSVCINSIIMSLLYNATPDEVKLLMIDPKVVELGVYNGIPHLLVPVVTDPRKAAGALGWAVSEMEKRYKMFAENDVRNLEGYNRLAEKSDSLIKMPHIVIIIDELADLMMTAPHEVEDSICRIAQKARAAGMHLLIATQRPSVDVITGIIKANIPSRIAFAVSSAVDSRTILDVGGAERLLGRGDMLFNPVGAIKPRRIQGCFVSDEEVEAVVEFIKGIRTDEYDSDIMDEIERQAAASKDGKGSKSSAESSGEDADPMLNAAIECVVENGQASTSLLQRRLKLGYARAARIMDEMEERGIIGPYEGAKARAVLLTKAQLMEMQARTDDVVEVEE